MPQSEAAHRPKRLRSPRQRLRPPATPAYASTLTNGLPRVGRDLAVGACGVTSLLSVIRYKRSKVSVRVPRPALPVAVAVVSCTLVLPACGSSGTPVSRSGSAAPSAGIKYADCMRTHGVPNFPDPSSADGAVQLSGSAINTQSPAFQSAQSACQKLLPGGLPAAGVARRHVSSKVSSSPSACARTA